MQPDIKFLSFQFNANYKEGSLCIIAYCNYTSKNTYTGSSVGYLPIPLRNAPLFCLLRGSAFESNMSLYTENISGLKIVILTRRRDVGFSCIAKSPMVSTNVAAGAS